jgi:hypothetical protein
MGAYFISFVVIGILLAIFWITQLLDLMSRKDDDFTGRYDKILWVAILLIGTVCGAVAYYIVRFIKEPKPFFDIKDSLKESPEPCIKCGKIIPAYSTKCPSCGWSYQEQEN